MTIAGNFGGEGQENAGGSSYPSIFGLQLAPSVIGALIAVLGLGGAVYLFISFVQPLLDKNTELQNKIAETKEKLNQLGAIQKKIARATEKNKEVKQQLGVVSALFASEKSLNTLLIDLNKRIEARNSNLPEDRIQAKLVKFEPDNQPSSTPGAPTSGIVNDGSLGAQLNGKIYRQIYNVQLEGTFDQTRLFLVDLERQKSLSIVTDLKSALAESTQKIAVDQQEGKIVPIGNPETKISTSFKLQVIRPLTPEELAKLAPPPAATPSPEATPAPTPAK